jgi:phenylalanyl-tRNA synthetase beta chain
VIIAGPSIGPRPAVTLRFTQLSRVLGIDISSEQARQILRALGLTESECTAQSATFTAPSWRPDLEREIDLVEEVARIHGYEHIPEDREVPLTSSARNRRERVEAEVRAILTGLGFDEAYTPSLVAEVLDESLVGGPVASGLRVDHSTRKRENTLRRGLVPSLLAVRAFNESRGSSDASLFEIASVYLPKPQGLPLEMSRLAIVGPGGFFEMKGTIEALVDRLRTGGPLQSERSLLPIFAQGRQAELKLEGRSLGFLGEVDASWMQRLEMHAPCVACELDFDLLMERAQLVAAAAPIPEFPAVERDLSLVVDRGLAWYDLARAVRNAAGPLLEDVSFLDTYQGKGIAEGAHSVHFGLRFRHRERTLKGEEVERALEAVVEACRERLGAALRT